jgi:hypothetical protein
MASDRDIYADSYNGLQGIAASLRGGPSLGAEAVVE